MKRKNPLKVATPEFRSLIRLCPPRPQRSPPVSGTSDVCDPGVYCGQCLDKGRELRWGIEFQSMRVNLTPGWAFPWSDVYSWFASLPTPNTWTHKQKDGNKTKYCRLRLYYEVRELTNTWDRSKTNLDMREWWRFSALDKTLCRPDRQTQRHSETLSSWRSQKDSLVWIFSLIF